LQLGAQSAANLLDRNGFKYSRTGIDSGVDWFYAKAETKQIF
jgi:hypothetical protein